jgi:hypothetical protein
VFSYLGLLPAFSSATIFRTLVACASVFYFSAFGFRFATEDKEGNCK